MSPVFGVRGACWLLGFSEWTFGALLFIGFWNKTAGVLGALGGIASFVGTTTIIPFMPGGWAASAGGFPAMTEKVAFLMKDLVLLAASFLCSDRTGSERHPRASHIRTNKTPKPGKNV